jgi:hypothetical protein
MSNERVIGKDKMLTIRNFPTAKLRKMFYGKQFAHYEIATPTGKHGMWHTISIGHTSKEAWRKASLITN